MMMRWSCVQACVSTSEALAKQNQTLSSEYWSVDHRHSIVPEGYFLIADTAFPRGTASIEGKIRAPLKGGEHVPRDLSAWEHLMSVN